MDYRIGEHPTKPSEVDGDHDFDSAASSDYDEEIEEITASEYARSNGLTEDYRLKNPFALIGGDLLASALMEYDDAHMFLSEQGLQQLFEERLQIDKQAALLLQEIITPPSPSENIRELYASGPPITAKRLPLPLLRTDNEFDMAYFASRRRRAGPDPQRFFEQFKQLTPFDVDEVKEAAFFGKTEHEDLFKEKLELPREALAILQEAMQEPELPADLTSLISSQLERAKNTKVRPITPPLLPREQPPTLPSPNSSALELDEWSMPSDLTSLELNEMLDNLYQSDQIPMPSPGDQDSFDVTIAPSSGSIQAIPPNRKRTNLKLEVPLLPADSDAGSNKRRKAVCFATTLPEVIPDNFWTGIFAFEPHPSSEEQYQELFSQIINTGDEAEATLSNEELDESDAILRPTVPDVPRYQPIRPWEAVDSEALTVAKLLSKTLLSSEESEYTTEKMKWVNVTRLERKLPWNPFPQGFDLNNLEDTFEEVQPYLDALTLDTTKDGLVESSSLTYKQPGLRLLDELDEEEDELKPALPSFPDDIHKSTSGGLASGTQQMLGGVNSVSLRESTQNKTLSTRYTRSSNSMNNSKIPSHINGEASEASTSTKSNRTDDPGTLLPNFLFTRGKPKDIVTDLSTPSYANTSSSGKPVPEPSREVEAFSDALEYQESDEPETVLENLQPTSAIVATSLYTSQRAMLRRLKAYWPIVTLIDRDFSNSDLSLATEADISLAPSTGLILTTLQKIKQKPLPGQPAQNLLHDRIATVGERYESIIVLVSEASSDTVPARPLDERDASALNDLTIFASSLDADVKVVFVPEGSNRLALQVIDCINTCRISQDHAKLFAEETHWERFLRRAGLNVCASQVILREHLQSPSLIRDHGTRNMQAGSSSSSEGQERVSLGLREFLAMTPGDRLERWAVIMGGTRVLHRVNAVLEQSWHFSTGDTGSSSVDSRSLPNDRHHRMLDIQTSDF